MTVKELREFLSNYDDDIEVGVSHDAGFCTAPLDAKIVDTRIITVQSGEILPQMQ